MHKSISNKFLSLCLALMMIIGLGVLFAPSFHAENSDITIQIPIADKDEMEKVFERLGYGSGTGAKQLEVVFKSTSKPPADTALLSFSSGTVVFHEATFNAATDKSRKNALSNFVKAMQNSYVSTKTQQIVFDNMNSADNNVSKLLIPITMDSTQADLFTAMRWIEPFLAVVRVIFGLGTILVVLLLSASTIMDLAYIGLPIMREATNGKEYSNGKIPFVTADAISTVKECESALGDSGGKYKNAYGLYFRRRAFTYIVLSFCILYLVVGELGGLISWLMSLAGGAIK